MSETDNQLEISKKEGDVPKDNHREREPQGITFEPPVYRQRYGVVCELVKKYNAKKVLDFGCAEGKLLRCLINNETNIEQLVGVDIDGELLNESKFRIEPLISDYLMPRHTPLTVSMYQGSISEADDRFCDFDLISCVEIIEHLIPEHLNPMPEVLFGQLSPKVVIVTTPNSDFNVLFPDLEGFRHWDHKFEWTREEFQEWSTEQASKYGYSVSFQGIGHGPIGTEHLGCCSQMALFEKNEVTQNTVLEKQSFGQPYALVKEVEHPYRKCTISEEDKILYEVERLLWFWSQPNQYKEEQDYDDTEDTDYNDDNVQKPYDLEQLFAMHTLNKLCGTVERLRSVLQTSRFELTEDGNSVLWCRPAEWSSENSEDSSGWEIDDNKDIHVEEGVAENWDSDQEDSSPTHCGTTVCWNTTDNACKYWDGVEHDQFEDSLEEGSNIEKDTSVDSKDLDFHWKFDSNWQGRSDNDGDEDGELSYALDDDDGLIWIEPGNSIK